MILLLMISLLVPVAYCRVDSDVLRLRYHREWQKLPPNVPANIKTEAELDAIHRFVAPIMSYGFGNMLFQMATAYSLANKLRTTCLVAWWDQSNPRLQRPKYLPFDGRPPPAPGITLKHIFPNIHYVDFYPATRNVFSKCAVRMHFSEATVYLPFNLSSLQKRGKVWIDAPFIHLKCLRRLSSNSSFEFIVFVDFHSSRQALMNDLFAFHLAMIKYATVKYFADIHGSRETVSVHFRLLSANESMPANLMKRPQATVSWYLHLMESEFDPSKVVFLVFSEDSRMVMPMLMNFRARIPAMQFVIVEEDFATALAVMTLCQHHIIPHSSFSFWGM
jgi:hypothetical protein